MQHAPFRMVWRIDIFDVIKAIRNQANRSTIDAILVIDPLFWNCRNDEYEFNQSETLILLNVTICSYSSLPSFDNTAYMCFIALTTTRLVKSFENIEC